MSDSHYPSNQAQYDRIFNQIARRYYTPDTHGPWCNCDHPASAGPTPKQPGPRHMRRPTTRHRFLRAAATVWLLASTAAIAWIAWKGTP